MLKRALGALAVVGGLACGEGHPDAQTPPTTRIASELVDTRIGPGCIRLPTGFRVVRLALSDDLIDAAYGYIDAPDSAWRVEWCSGSCMPPTGAPRPLTSATPTPFASFWVDASRPAATKHFAEILEAFEKREHPEQCADAVNEVGDPPG